VKVAQHAPEVLGCGFLATFLWIVTPECHGVVIHIEWLFDICRLYRGKALLSEPSGKFHSGPRPRAVVGITVEANDNAFGLEQVQSGSVLVKWHATFGI
jgi:hypothetical protein